MKKTAKRAWTLLIERLEDRYRRIGLDSLPPARYQFISEQLEARVLLSIPPIPSGTSPGSISSPGPMQSSSTVPLSWSSSSGATYYEVAVRNLNTNAIVIDTTTSALSYSASLASATPYRWDVAAGNSS